VVDSRSTDRSRLQPLDSCARMLHDRRSAAGPPGIPVSGCFSTSRAASLRRRFRLHPSYPAPAASRPRWNPGRSPRPRADHGAILPRRPGNTPFFPAKESESHGFHSWVPFPQPSHLPRFANMYSLISLIIGPRTDAMTFSVACAAVTASVSSYCICHIFGLP